METRISAKRCCQLMSWQFCSRRMYAGRRQTDNVNNPVRAADDIYWALILDREGNKFLAPSIRRVAAIFFFLLPKISFQLLRFCKSHRDCCSSYSFFPSLNHTRWQNRQLRPGPPAPAVKSLAYHYVPTSHSVVNFTPLKRCNRQIRRCWGALAWLHACQN